MSTAETGQLIFLGTGTSVGVPTLGCDCVVCQSNDRRDHRTRCAVLLGLPQGNLLIDTPPDLRTQLLRERIKLVHSVVYTHGHADHLFGLDDVRLFPFRLGHAMPLYCESAVEKQIRQAFAYAFTCDEPTHLGAVPQLQFRSIDTGPFDALGACVQPIRLLHGPRFQVLGFRVGDIAYCTDVKEIPPESWRYLEGLKHLILGALRFRPHPTHMNLEEALATCDRVRPKQTWLTHLSHEFGHEETEKLLPGHVRLAYDGLRLPLV